MLNTLERELPLTVMVLARAVPSIVIPLFTTSSPESDIVRPLNELLNVIVPLSQRSFIACRSDPAPESFILATSILHTVDWLLGLSEAVVVKYIS